MLKNHKFYLNIVWMFILFTVPLPLIVTLTLGLDELYTFNITYINLGIFAYVWMLSAIYLATKPKWLDNLLGLPDMYLIHGVTTIFALVLMWIHKLNLPSAGLIELSGEFSLYLITFLIAYSLIFLAGWLTSKVKILALIKRSLEKIFKHEITVWIHRLNIVAVLVIYVHIILIDYVRNITPFFVLTTIYTLFTFGAYVVYLVGRNNPYTGKLTEVVMLDKNVVELNITLGKKALSKIKAGDFVFINFPNNKKLREPHPFSIVNVPNRDGYIKLAVDCVGDFTSELKNLRGGERATVTRGYGVLNNILTKSSKNEKFVFIAGGIGVTSLLSLADGFADKNITFFYTAKKEKKLLYLEKLASMRERGNFKIYAQNGRFTDEQLKKALPIGEEYSYIIAGPMS